MLKRPELKPLNIDDGSHEATCKGVEEITMQWKDQPPEPGVKFLWEVIDNEGNAIEMQRRTSIRTGAKSILRSDMVAVHGAAAWDAAIDHKNGSDEAFDALIKSTVGKSAIATVTSKEDQMGFVWKNITGLAAIPKRRVAKTAEPEIESAEPQNGKRIIYNMASEPDEKKREAIRAYFVKVGAEFKNGCAITEKEYPKLAYLASGYAGPKQTPAEEDEIPF